MIDRPLITRDYFSPKVSLTDPVSMPDASGYLWNKKMMLQMNCRGFATSQFMQPEPAKYSNSPVVEAPGFMQPEPQYFAHHPGRFFYVCLGDSWFSLPYEPMRVPSQQFEFSQHKDGLEWKIQHGDLEFCLILTLPVDDTLELWTLEVTNNGDEPQDVDIVPHFSIGYMSWMNQSAGFVPPLNAIVANKVTPYQKIEDYHKQRDFSDITFLASDGHVESWCASLRKFEGEGGLHNPDALHSKTLGDHEARYETPVAVLKHKVALCSGQKHVFKYLFGAAKSRDDIHRLKARYLDDPEGFSIARARYHKYVQQGHGSIRLKSPDPVFDQFVNVWLPRQVFYHGDVNRLTTDPQTRNYLQDAMGMIYINPEAFPNAFLTALSQQHTSGEMPDGILLDKQAKLKFINQVPHSDHCVWLSLTLSAYLSETGDLDLLHKTVGFKDSDAKSSVFQHMQQAMGWLLEHLDHRQLSLISQGDWCDPMNMVGHRGAGVSCWLSQATVWALESWAAICCQFNQVEQAEQWRHRAQRIRLAVNQHFWDGNWYARGINDDGRTFGISEDQEGRIYLNPQSWALLSDTADKVQQNLMINQIQRQLMTPYGAMMLAPAYTQMDEGIGRLTQKFPGVAENGSVYNHAVAFLIYALYKVKRPELAFEQIRKMLITADNQQVSGQLPVFIPNYFRGAYYQHPASAGRSSQLFNTGTVAWLYRTIIEQLLGVKGENGELVIDPQLPNDWPQVKISRKFAHAWFDIEIQRTESLQKKMWLDGVLCEDCRVTSIESGKRYQVKVEIPEAQKRCKQ